MSRGRGIDPRGQDPKRFTKASPQLVRKITKQVLKATRSGVRILPKGLRHALYRGFVQLPEHFANEYELRVATTQHELEEAFRLAHSAYVDAGFMKPDPSQLRVTKYHALPTTTTLIVLHKKKIIGTLSIIQDSPFGLPLDDILDISKLRKKNRRIAEMSSLAIARDHRGNLGHVLFLLTKFLYNYCERCLHLDCMIATVNPRHADFYEGILLFKRLSRKTVGSYAFANGNPAVGFMLDLRKALKKYFVTYGKRCRQRNLFDFYVKCTFPNLIFPSRTYFRAMDPVMTPPLLDYFFNQKTNTFSVLDDRERYLLKVMYSHTGYRKVLPKTKKENIFPTRKETRFPAHLTGAIYPPVEKSILLTVKDVSLKGFQAITSRALPLGQPLQLELNIGIRQTIKLTAFPRWSGKRHVHGFEIDGSNSDWHSFISHLQQKVLQP